MFTELQLENLAFEVYCVRQVFPDSKVERKDEFIVVDDLIYFQQIKINKPTMRGIKQVDGWEASIAANEEEFTIIECESFNNALVKAVEWYAGWHANNKLTKIQEQLFAQQLEKERKAGLI